MIPKCIYQLSIHTYKTSKIQMSNRWYFMETKLLMLGLIIDVFSCFTFHQLTWLFWSWKWRTIIWGFLMVTAGIFNFYSFWNFIHWSIILVVQWIQYISLYTIRAVMYTTPKFGTKSGSTNAGVELNIAFGHRWSSQWFRMLLYYFS